MREFVFEDPNEEERMYTKTVEELILNHHNVKLIKRLRRFKINNKPNLETDVVLLVSTPTKQINRTIGIELKQTDLIKAVTQAIERRKYFNWFYIVIGISVRAFLEWIFRDTNLFFALKDYDIGVILGYDEIMLLPSKFYNVFNLTNFVFQEEVVKGWKNG